MEDQKTYQRAVGVSLLGLFIQLVVTGALWFLWRYSATNEVMGSAFWHAAGGLGIWATLWLLYMQHKQERVEAMEAEQIAGREGGDSAMFAATVDDLAVQRKRLAWLYKWVAPGVALLTSVYLMWYGIQLLQSNDARVDKLALPEGKTLTLMASFAAIAFVGFLISRYLAGMSRVREWVLLRSGASYLMGSVLISVLIAVGTLLTRFEFQWMMIALLYVVPIFMVLIGFEIVLNFILNLYRPRKVGEIPRLAFDSRLLSFLTTPESIAKSINEAINYQFGFEITKSWFWELLSQSFVRLVGLGVIVILLVSSVVVVEPGRGALVTRFGQLRGRMESGINFKLPWPVDRATYFDTDAVRVITIGRAETADEKLFYKMPDQDQAPAGERNVVLWSNRHAEGELNMIVAPSAQTGLLGSTAVEGDTEGEASTGKIPPISVVNAEVMVHYKLKPELLAQYVRSNADAEEVERKHLKSKQERAGWNSRERAANKYEPAPNDHAALLRNMAIGHVTRFLLRSSIEDWIGEAGMKSAPALLAAIRKDAEPLGVEVLDVAIAGIHPPQVISDAFHEVINAQQKSETTIENAHKEAIRIKTEAAGTVELADEIFALITRRDELGADAAGLEEIGLKIEDLLRRSGGESAVIIALARASRWEIENRERGRAMAFEAQYEAYRAAPSYYLTRKYLQAASLGLADSNKIIIAANRSDVTIRGDYKEVQTSFSFDRPTEQ